MDVLDVDLTCCFTDKMEEALKKKDQDLGEAQKEALNKTKLAEENWLQLVLLKRKTPG